MRVKWKFLGLCAFFALAALWVPACWIWVAPFPNHKSIRLIPGTEQVHPADGAMSLSRNDRWLVFSEYRIPSPEVFKYPDLPYYRVSTIDLESGTVRRHVADGPCASEAYFELIGTNSVCSWQDSLYVLKKCGGRRSILVANPACDTLAVTRRNERRLTCSDCPDLGPTDELSKWVGTFSRHSTLALQTPDGVPALYYINRGIWRASPGEEDVAVVRGRSKRVFGMLTQFGQIRVSPNGRYLAYCVGYSLEVPVIPGRGWVVCLVLRDLLTGREVQLAARSALGNFVWSSDSQTLYFAGADLPDNFFKQPAFTGICVAEVSTVFGDD